VRRTVSPEDRQAAYGLTPLGESLKPVVGGMYEWGLRFITPTLRPAWPALRAGRPLDTPRAAVLRLLAEGPAKPKQSEEEH
jgi:hypothetical protein